LTGKHIVQYAQYKLLSKHSGNEMNEEQLDDDSDLIVDDDALDYILFKEMEKEDRQSQNKRGCLSLVLFMLIPPASMYLLSHFIR